VPAGPVERLSPIAGTVTGSENDETAVWLLVSVTVRVTEYGEPPLPVGVQLIEAALEVVHPGGRFVHA
jgi:hypothetical protein